MSRSVLKSSLPYFGEYQIQGLSLITFRFSKNSLMTYRSLISARTPFCSSVTGSSTAVSQGRPPRKKTVSFTGPVRNVSSLK